ncbi:General secretion pathway protein H [Sterolibacterium denitrificans]|uniref:General secretion pathway protein H n=1 Tax=Sterolibacterium denitrificans TaxID=157592 RepID=A0A7Z7MUV2_9PROT|nr:prepilin-type N-terminal cleavage/methylation domain-containing protein [Sterolibacterium denitrificans]SMB24238.1 General secretion pathway protein H [Sterolibacterium denitrificans]
MRIHPHPYPHRPQRGFSLIEMAIVLLVVGLLLGSGLGLLGAQLDLQRTRASQKILEDARESLIGFAMANGRLPCPASPVSQGIESPEGGGVCTHPYDGLLPGVTLGLPGVDGQGYLTDAWSLPANRIRYAVTTAHGSSATTTDGMRNTGMATFTPNLSVCSSASGMTASSCGAATALTNTAVAVILAPGKNAASGGSGLDEATNLAGNRFFVSHAPSASGAANGEFDDILTWLSSNVLYSRLVQAGRLP